MASTRAVLCDTQNEEFIFTALGTLFYLGVESLPEESETSELWVGTWESLLDAPEAAVGSGAVPADPVLVYPVGLGWRGATLATSASQHHRGQAGEGKGKGNKLVEMGTQTSWGEPPQILRAILVILQEDGVGSATLNWLVVTKLRIPAWKRGRNELFPPFPGR